MAAKHNYYKFTIQTKDGAQLSNVIEYKGLILGKIPNTMRPDNPLRRNRKEMFALIRYSADSQPETLWQGEIANFEPGYNLEIFPHPESLRDYLIFTHPISNMAASHCYWLRVNDNSGVKTHYGECVGTHYGECVEIVSAQIKLRGLKYIHYHNGKFIGVFHSRTTQRIHLGNPHDITIGRIIMSFRDAKKQLIQRGKKIDINIINIRHLDRLNPIYRVFNRICSHIPQGEDYMVFQLNLAVQVKYNILTQELSSTTEIIEFRQPDGSLLQGWDDMDMPQNPVYSFLHTFPINGTPDLLVYDGWTWGDNNVYIYRQSDKRFHRINDAPDYQQIGYNEIKFLTPNLATICKYNLYTGEYIHFLTEVDTDKLTFKIVGESSAINHQSIAVANTHGSARVSLIHRDSVFEQIRRTKLHQSSSLQQQPSSRTDYEITKVADVVCARYVIPYQIGMLIGKFALSMSSRSQTVCKLDD